MHVVNSNDRPFTISTKPHQNESLKLTYKLLIQPSNYEFRSRTMLFDFFMLKILWLVLKCNVVYIKKNLNWLSSSCQSKLCFLKLIRQSCLVHIPRKLNDSWMAADLSHLLSVDAKKHKYEKTVKIYCSYNGENCAKGSVATEQILTVFRAEIHQYLIIQLCLLALFFLKHCLYWERAREWKTKTNLI